MARSQLAVCSVGVLVLVLGMAAPADAIYSQCSACKAVAYELQKRLDKEIPKALPAAGKESKPSYKFSELRMIELFEDLCKNMYHYTLGKKDDKPTGRSHPAWMKVSGESTIVIDGAVTLGGPETGHRGREIEHYCGKMVENLEDELMEAIRSDEHTNGGVETMLCRRLTNHCGTIQNPLPPGGDTTKAEL